MRVGIDGRALQFGYKEHWGRGIGLYAAELVRALARRDDLGLTVYVDPAFSVDDALVPPGVEVRRYPWPRTRVPARVHWTTQIGLPVAVRSAGVDVFHVLTHLDAPALGAPRMVVTVHDIILEVLREHYAHRKPPVAEVVRALERRAIRRAAHLVVDSARSGDDVVRVLGVDAARITVAHLGIDRRFSPRGPDQAAPVIRRFGIEPPFMLYLGGIDERKNPDGLLRSYALARDMRPELPRLVFAGKIQAHPAFPALERTVEKLGLEGRVLFTGFVPDDDLPALLSAAELFVFPSLYEGFGLPPLEAMACGVPVIATTAGSLPEVLGNAAELVPPGDEPALTDAILRVLGSPALAAELRARGRQQAARFTWEATARATIEAYRRVRVGPASAPAGAAVAP